MADTLTTYHTVTPYLVVPDADAELKFLKTAFGATQSMCQRNSDNTVMHAEIKIGDSLIMLGQAGEQWKALQCRAIPLGRERRRRLRQGAGGRRDLPERAGRQALRTPQRRRRRPLRHHLVDRLAG